MKTVIGILAMVLVILLSNCADIQQESETESKITPTMFSSVATPPDGINIRDIAIKNGPTKFSVPKSSKFTNVIDKPNVVTLVFAAPNPSVILNYYRHNLNSMGFEIETDSSQAILFSDGRWQGAYTFGGGLAGLTLRLKK